MNKLIKVVLWTMSLLCSVQAVHAESRSDEIIPLLFKGDSVLDANPDSALKIYHQALFLSKNQSVDTLKALAAIYIATYYDNNEINVDSSDLYYHKAIDYYKQAGKEYKVAETYNLMATMQRDHGDYQTSLEYYNQDLAISRKLNDTLHIAYTLNDLGTLYSYMGEYETGIGFYMQSLALKEKMGDSLLISSSYLNLGMTHIYAENFETGKQYLEKAYSIYESLGEIRRLGNCCINLGIVSSYLDDNEKALEYFEKAIGFFDKVNYRWGMPKVYNNMGAIMELYDKHEEAISYYLKAADLYEELGDVSGYAGALGNLSSSYAYAAEQEPGKDAKQKLCRKAIPYAMEGLSIANNMGIKPLRRDIYQHLIRIYRVMGEFEKALDYSIKYSDLKDSIMSEKKTEAIAEMETRYQAEKKQLEIEKLEQETLLQTETIARQDAESKKQMVILYSFVAGFVVILVFSIALYRLFLQKKKANQLISERNASLQMANEEISAQKEEIAAQRDRLNDALVELKQTQDQLVESEKMAALSSIVTGVAHEINTPVGIGVTASSALIENIKVIANRFSEGNMSKSDFRSFLEDSYETCNLILKNMNRAGDLVKSFKQVSVDQLSEQEREFNLVEYIQEVMDTLSPELRKKRVAVEVTGETQFLINSYPGVFAQIFTNLAINSFVHGFDGEGSNQISVEVSVSGDSVQILYRDNGKGIPGEIIPKIFDPFVTSNKQAGTGLGMNIVYNLVVQKLRGTISCGNLEKRGAFFNIKFPL